MPSRHRLFTVCLLAFVFFGAALSVQGQQRAARPNPLPRYSMGAYPFFPAPPHRFRGNRIFSIVFKTTPEVLRELVPQPLVPNSDNLLIVYIGSLNASSVDYSTRTVSYHEAGILVPVVFPRTNAPGTFAVSLYLDTPVGIAAGREIWGFPKKDAKLTFSVKDGQVSGTVERLGTVLLRVNAKLENKVEPVPDQRELPFLVEKLIPSARRNAPPDVWELVSVRTTDSKTNEYWHCTGSIQLGSGPEDPLGRIKVLGIVRAALVNNDFSLDYGEIIHDYLSRQ